MDFTLSKEQMMLVKSLPTMGERKILEALAKRIDETGVFPFELVAGLAELGFLGIPFS